jgi:hypothetical protein
MTAPADLTPEDLAAIEARCEAATPGPWENSYANDTGPDDEGFWEWLVVDTADGEPVAKVDLSRFNKTVRKQEEHDAAFIAAARADIPRLLAAVREQSDRVKHYQWEASQLQAERDAARAELAESKALLAERDAEIERLTDAISFSEVKVRAELAESKALLARAVVLLKRWQNIDTPEDPYFCETATVALLAEIEGADHGSR